MSILFYVYLVLLGFALASAFEEVYAKCAGQRLQFLPPDEQDIVWEAPRFLLSILAGPGILMRNCLAAIVAKRLSIVWLFLVGLIVIFWSFCLGVLAVDFYIYLSTPNFG